MSGTYTSHSLANSPTSMSLLQIIPANPHLLLLIRVAPYPYNLLNVILASSPSLSLSTYTACTALSLCKLVVHTWIGAGIHDLSATHLPEDPEVTLRPSDSGLPPHHHSDDSGRWMGGAGQGDKLKVYTTWAGIALCVALFFYLTHLAKRALARAQEEQEMGGEGAQMSGVTRVGV